MDEIKYIDFHDVIECLIAAIEARDRYTSGHSSRVADLTLRIARGIGIKDPQLDAVHMAAHMHDIGKIGIPDEILSKTGELEHHERELIRKHPRIGYDILSRSKALTDIAVIVLHHHERWDGKGYPDGLKGDNIPIGSRIIAVADAIDAMLSERPYRKALTEEECIRELKANSGFQFELSIVNTALETCFPLDASSL